MSDSIAPGDPVRPPSSRLRWLLALAIPSLLATVYLASPPSWEPSIYQHDVSRPLSNVVACVDVLFLLWSVAVILSRSLLRRPAFFLFLVLSGSAASMTMTWFSMPHFEGDLPSSIDNDPLYAPSSTVTFGDE